MRSSRRQLLAVAVVTGLLVAGCTESSSPPPNSGPAPRQSTSDQPATRPAALADRTTTWNPGVSHGGGGIPARSTVCANVSPSGGDDTAVIQAAIDNCPPDQVVRLSAGTFTITGNGVLLARSGVILRGAGTGTPGTGEGGTRLVKSHADEDSANHAVIYLGNQFGSDKFASSTDLAADAVKGTNSVTLAGNPGLRPGEFVLIDHDTMKDPDVVWGQRHVTDFPGGESRAWFVRQDRSLSQILEVKSVEGNTVTFATPLHWTFKTAFKAQLSRYGEHPDGPVLPFVTWSGIEDLHVSGGRGGDGHGNIAMVTCAYCWVRNIESTDSEGTAIGMYATYRSEIRDSYIHSSANPNPGGGGYLTGVHSGASDNLLENNIMWNGNKPIVMRGSGGGNVVGYNYLEDAYGADYKDYPESGLNASHYTTPHMELLEGNQSFNADGESVWGNSIFITMFRNHLTGQRRSVGGLGLTDKSNRRVVGLSTGHYHYSFLGNVLGTDGMSLVGNQKQFVHEATAPHGDDVVPMWKLGTVDDGDTPFDPKVAATILRHGNFDYVLRKVTWDPALPRSLPPSLYLRAKPAFFGDQPWPWVNPENPDRLIATLPARARFDAMH